MGICLSTAQERRQRSNQQQSTLAPINISAHADIQPLRFCYPGGLITHSNHQNTPVVPEATLSLFLKWLFCGGKSLSQVTEAAIRKGRQRCRGQNRQSLKQASLKGELESKIPNECVSKVQETRVRLVVKEHQSFTHREFIFNRIEMGTEFLFCVRVTCVFAQSEMKVGCIYGQLRPDLSEDFMVTLSKQYQYDQLKQPLLQDQIASQKGAEEQQQRAKEENQYEEDDIFGDGDEVEDMRTTTTTAAETIRSTLAEMCKDKENLQGISNLCSGTLKKKGSQVCNSRNPKEQGIDFQKQPFSSGYSLFSEMQSLQRFASATEKLNHNPISLQPKPIHAPPQKPEILIIFDWDDTLFPTTQIQEAILNGREDRLEVGEKILLQQLDYQVQRVLKASMKFGRVFICTST